MIYQSWISDDTEKVKIKNLEVSSINSYYKNRLKKAKKKEYQTTKQKKEGIRRRKK